MPPLFHDGMTKGGPCVLSKQRTVQTCRSKRLAVVPTSLKVDQSLAEEEYTLDCLGAAVMMRWATLPAKIQRELFEYATSHAGLTQEAHLRGRIGRFLHNHKDGDDRTIDNDGA